jgi:hypothetical protein
MALVLAMGCQGGSRSRGPLPIPMSDAAVEGDGATVTADARVDASPTCTPGPEDNLRACTDGCDNDGDPFVDCDDRDCCAVRSDCPASTWCGSHVPAEDSGTPECVTGPENTAAACSDGCDNDGDPFVDCEDYDCCGVVSCPVSSACGMVEWGADFVSTRAPDCVGTGSVFYTFSATRYEMVTVAFSTSTGYQVFGYTRGDITRGPFPLMGMTDERQVRVADLGSGLQMALSRWGGSAWSSSEGGSASYSDSSTVNLASDAEDRYASHACVGYVEGFATAPVLGGVDYMHFEFVAPVLGLAFPGI